MLYHLKNTSFKLFAIFNLNKFTCLAIICFLFVAIKPERTLAATYYISSSTGSNSNSGTDSAHAWKSINVAYSTGVTYLFKRGDTFYFPIGYIYSTNVTTLADYGNPSLPKPIICLYKKINKSAWTLQSGNIWTVNLKDSASYTGYLNNIDTNVGFMNVDGNIKGAKRTGVNSLKNQWDFYSDSAKIYVYSSDNPGNLSCSIQIAVNRVILLSAGNLTVRNLQLVGTGAHAFQSSSGASNITIRSVDIREIGGSVNLTNGTNPRPHIDTVRYGNGVEFWAGASNCIADSCTYQNIYDVATTMQGGGAFTNIVFSNSTMKNNEQMFEFENGGTTNAFTNCSFTNNYCENAGFGWSYSVRPDKDSGVHILLTNSNRSGGVTISHNIFKNARTGYTYFKVPDSGNTSFFAADYNTIYLNPAVWIRSIDDRFYIKNNQAFVSQFGIDQHSTFNSIP